MYEGEKFLVSITLLILSMLALSMGFALSSDIETIGEIVCIEKGYDDFKDFDSDSKTIKCVNSTKQKYDGGFIVGVGD